MLSVQPEQLRQILPVSGFDLEEGAGGVDDFTKCYPCVYLFFLLDLWFFQPFRVLG